jgi:O-antigen ligase
VFKLNETKFLNANEIYFLLFPIAILLRSAALNGYIILGAIFFIFNIKKNKKIFSLLPVKILSIFIIYLILISFNAENISQALKSSISQIRFLLFMLFIVFLDIRKDRFPLIFFFFSILIYFIILDTLWQYFFAVDFFGIAADPVTNPNRLSGPFGKELIVGSYIAYFSIPIIAFYFSRIKNTTTSENVYYISFAIFSFIAILLSGERISLLIFLSSICILLFIYLDKIKLIAILVSLVMTIIFAYNYNQGVKNRFNNFRDDVVNFKNSNHGKLFSSAYIVWKKNYLIGTGLKNYRLVCNSLYNDNFIDKFTNTKIVCSTHPHNVYFEVLAETGIIGLSFFLTFVVLSVILFLKNKKTIKNELSPLYYSSLIILFISYIWPIKSAGSFFSTYSASYFWFYYGILLMCIKNSNPEKI